LKNNQKVKQNKTTTVNKSLVGIGAICVVIAVIFLFNREYSRNSVDFLDYSDAANWAYFEDSSDKTADVFLICPTVDLGVDENMNMRMDDMETKANFLGALNMERGIYDEDANMFSPYYRQMTLPVYDLDPSKSVEYLNIAYGDVRAAFEYYLTNVDPHRPIVLAGFSQGSQLLLMLLKDCFNDEALQNRLVAAYMIGWRVTDEDLQEHPWLKTAQGEDDLGVIVAFNSEAEGITDSLLIPEGTFTYSINPLNWMTDGTPAESSMNLGACFTDYSGNINSEIPALCGAYINEERGSLIVTDITPADYPGILFPDGIYHLYDYQFFYRNLQKNVKIRVAA